MRAALSGSLLAVLLCATGAVGQEPKERKNIDKLTPDELAAYKHAVDVLKKSTDPKNNYAYYANFHDVFGNDPPRGCEHGNDLFFPWHRHLLALYEKALQAADPGHPTLSTKNVTVPYWDWSSNGSGARYPKAFEEAGSPLANEFRNPGPNIPAFDTAYMTNLIRNNPDWNQFAGGVKGGSEFYGALEQPAHNFMHATYIGDVMADPTTAAEDPIFWSFHAFIDMQWDRWQKTYGKPPTSLGATLRGFPTGPTVADVVEVRTLGYFYTHPEGSITPPVATAALAPLQPRAVKLLAKSPEAERTTARWGGEGPFPFQLTIPNEKFQKAALWVEGVQIPQTLSYQLEAYLHPADTPYEAKPEFKKKYSVGALSVWKGHGTGGHAGHSRAGMFIDVSAPLRKLARTNAGETWVLTLAVSPNPTPARPGAFVKATPLPLRSEVQFDGVQLVLDNGGPFRPGGKEAGRGH